MKKIVLTILLIVTAFITVNAQAYYDAVDLHKLPTIEVGGKIRFAKNDSVRLVEILRKYVPGATSYSQIWLAFSSNPYFTLPSVNSQAGGRAPFSVTNILSSGTFSSFGKTDVTQVADGIARFLVARTKQELNIYFFQRFNEFLNDDEYGKDIQLLFPNTHAILLLAKDDIYNYQQYLQSFREAFSTDLASLLVTVNQWINQDPATATRLARSVQSLQTLYPYLQLALQLAVDLQADKHPGDILKNLAAKKFIESMDTDIPSFSSSIKAMDIFSQSLRTTDENEYWISGSSFKFFEDPKFIKIYLGLMYHQFSSRGDIKFGGIQFSEILAQLAGRQDQIILFINEFRKNIREAETVFEQLTATPGNGQLYHELLNNVIAIANLPRTLVPDIPEIKIEHETALFVFTHSVNLATDIRSKSYNAAVVELSLILQKVNQNITGNAKIPERVLNGLLKYGMFMANVATAKTSEEVNQAIEVIALPPGSYQVKRESRANISINGYLGLIGGVEYLPASDLETRFSGGVFAPVGVAFSSGGLCKKAPEQGGKSLTLFVSAIDVGAIASFRFNDQYTSVASTIQLKDIIAPGAYVIWGLGKSPLSIGMGAQLGPNLRKIDAAAAAEINQDYYIRYGFFVAVDIPVLNLYNRKDRTRAK